MAYKFTIKGIRKFNEEKVVEKALVSYRGIDNDPEVKAAIKREQSDARINSAEREQARLKIKVMYHETLGEEKESYTVMTVNVSSQGVNIKHMIGGNIIVELPWLASQMDVRLCYAYLNAVKKVHRGARIMDEEDKAFTRPAHILQPRLHTARRHPLHLLPALHHRGGPPSRCRLLRWPDHQRHLPQSQVPLSHVFSRLLRVHLSSLLFERTSIAADKCFHNP